MRTPEEARKATAAQARYDAKNTRRVMLKLNVRTDADVIAWLESQSSMQGAVKDLIREKMEGKEMSNASDSKQKRRAYKQQWEAENYDKVLLRLPKGLKDQITATGESLNGFIVAAIQERLERIAADDAARP